MTFEAVSSSTVPRELASRATAAVEAVIEAGAALLIAEPWRVNRIIRGAEGLTLEQLRAKIAWRCAPPSPADFNRALALAQVARALDEPSFATMWSSECTGSNRAARQILPAATA